MPFLSTTFRLIASLCALASILHVVTSSSSPPATISTPPSVSARAAAAIANGGATPPLTTPTLPNVVTFNTEAAQIPCVTLEFFCTKT